MNEENVLLKLNEDQKLVRFMRISLLFQNVGQIQLNLLKQHEKLNRGDLHTGFFYLIRTLESFWENLDFLCSLQRNKYKGMAHYPTRLMFETLFRIEYYVNKKREEQNYITTIETLRIYKRLYDFKISKKEDVKDIKKIYDDYLKISDLENDPNFIISEVKENKLNPFPMIENLINGSKLPQEDGLYFHYRMLCEHSHGKLIAALMRNQNPKQFYKQMLMYGCIFARDMIKIVDHHIEGASKNEVNDALLRSQDIINMPHQNF